MTSSWEKKPTIKGKYCGCVNCGPRPIYFPASSVIAVGFGYAGLHCDGAPVHVESKGDGEYMTGAQAEELASADPDHDWQIVLDGPLSGRTYQRHGPGEWALIEQTLGFA